MQAYDTVWREGLLWQLHHKGIRGRLFRVLANIADASVSTVGHRGAYSEPFATDLGWEQGDTLATTMYNVYIDAVLREVWAAHTGVPLPSATPETQEGEHRDKVVALLYADDMIGFAETEASLQQLMEATRAAMCKWRMKASVDAGDGSKTAVMVIRHAKHPGRSRGRQPSGQRTQWQWGELIVPQVQEYKYLGVYLSAEDTYASHFKARKTSADAAARTYGSHLREDRTPMKLRKLILAAAIQPILSYASEVWSRATLEHRRRLDGWQMGHVTSMLGLPATATHHCVQ